MIKQVHIFLLFLKIDENNSYLFFKNYSLFHFIFKKIFLRNNNQTLLKKNLQFYVFKNKKIIFKSYD